MRVLIVAYACEPGRGSEPGAGWGLVQAVESFAECIVLVGPEHVAAIRRYEAEHPTSTRFVEVPEIAWAQAMKRHRISWFLAYLMWLRKAKSVARSLLSENDIDVVHHATYSTYWLPSPVTDIAKPSVWGPVGGAVTTPTRLWRLLGWRGVVSEIVDRIGVGAARWLPATRHTWTRATVRIMQNDESRHRLPRRLRSTSLVLNHGQFITLPSAAPQTREDFFLWVSPMETRKGPRLAIEALSHSRRGARLVMAGDGPEREPVLRLAGRLGLAERVDLRGWIARDEVLDLLDRAAAVIFTGLREEGGISLTEALLRGAPVIVVASGGAKTLCEAATDPGRVALVPLGSATEMAKGIGSAMDGFVTSPATGSGPLLDLEAARATLAAAFHQAIGGGETPAP